MRVVRIPKGNGKVRTIYAVNSEEKRAYKRHQLALEPVVDVACPAGVVHGFYRGRSPVTCALAHVGKQYTITMDLRDFFDTVNRSMLVGFVESEVLDAVLVDGAPRQGLPTSPVVANIAAGLLDREILNWARINRYEIVYTRYADDLTFSCDDKAILDAIARDIPHVVTRCGFTLAKEKTHVYHARGGKRIVVGVAVDDHGVSPTRAVKRKLRAAMHQGNSSSADGLSEWCKLKLPKAWVEAQGRKSSRRIDRAPPTLGKQRAVTSTRRIER